jgi:NADH-quinone oxidoreductase subunit N
MWAPDVYEGAPLPITAYLAIGSKAAAFALVLRLFAEGIVPVADIWGRWQLIVAVMAAVTMLVGNLVALAQRNLKRLMAYSSIGHVGFLLAGIAALGPGDTLVANGIILYLVGYAVTSIVVFAALIAFFNHTGQEEIADLAGLADRQPFLAAALAIGMFSLSGLPIFAGFTIKFYLFTAVARAGFLWLAALAVFASFISLYYYLQVIRQMYIQPAPGAPPEQGHGHAAEPTPAETQASAIPSPGWLLTLVLGLGLAGVFWLGVYPAPLVAIIEGASRAILPGG